MLVQDLGYHGLGLVLFAAAVQHPQEVARSQLAPQPFFEQVGIVAYEVICAFQDAARGAVVLLQFDELQARKVLLQQGQILGSGPPPGIHGLVVVPHGREGPAHAYELFHQLILTGVGVLVFVDQQVAGAVLPTLEGLGVLPEKLYRQQDEIIEIHCVVGPEVALVEGVQPGRRGFDLVFRPGERPRRRHKGVLPAGHL